MSLDLLDICTNLWLFDSNTTYKLLSQAECDELALRAEALKEENANLKSEVNQIRSKYEQLLAENATLKVMCDHDL